MITTVMRRLGGLLIAVVAASSVPFMTPAWACGCGAYSPGEGGRASVPTETALVRYTGGAEDVYLSLTVESTTRSGALLFPVPDRKASVTAGPTSLFSDLADLTDPPAETGAIAGDGAKAQAPDVTVENRQQIGPLDVATLSSHDPAALTRWLQRNGFVAKPALATAARPYTEQGWAFVAVRIRPSAMNQALRGRLDPLRIHFTTGSPVYPMRLSAMASEPEEVRLYVLGDHRTRLVSGLRGLSPTWAGHVGDYTVGADLTKVVAGGPDYLTRFDGRLDPATIDDDIHFAVAGNDETLGSTDARPAEHGGDAAGPRAASSDTALIFGIVIGGALLAVLVGVALRQRRSGPSAAQIVGGEMVGGQVGLGANDQTVSRIRP